jgi:hypothetical protein
MKFLRTQWLQILSSPHSVSKNAIGIGGGAPAQVEQLRII